MKEQRFLKAGRCTFLLFFDNMISMLNLLATCYLVERSRMDLPEDISIDMPVL